MRAAALLMALAAVARPGRALYFSLSEGTQRCFIQDLPDATLVVGSYVNRDAFSAEAVAPPVTVRGAAAAAAGARALCVRVCMCACGGKRGPPCASRRRARLMPRERAIAASGRARDAAAARTGPEGDGHGPATAGGAAAVSGGQGARGWLRESVACVSVSRVCVDEQTAALCRAASRTPRRPLASISFA